MLRFLKEDVVFQINRATVSQKIAELFGDELANEYVRQIEAHEIYVHDETSLKPYCVSMTLYPFLRDGLIKLGGESRAPQHLESFCGSFVNLVFAVSAQFSGAVATVEFLTYFDYFARKDYGENYLKDHPVAIANHLQHVVYALNQPAAARGYQSVFWNISVYDQYYFDAMFSDFVFPDFTKPSWGSVSQLQDFFMSWFNRERNKAILTFPVVTAALLTKDGQRRDQLFAKKLAGELSEGNSFFMYMSDNADSLASCCRLRSEISDNTFSYTLGAGGVATGSINVITLNMNRLTQDGRELIDYLDGGSALHLNLEESLTVNGYLALMQAAARTGCNYFCINVRITICNHCEHIDKRTLNSCPECYSLDIDYGTRVIGYLKRVSAFSAGRRKEHCLRHYHRQGRGAPVSVEQEM